MNKFLENLRALGISVFHRGSIHRIKTPHDLARVAGLPVLATLGDLRRLDAKQQEAWAFRAWTAVQSRVATSRKQGLVCGITSAEPGEGRTTVVSLLARAASVCGFRVLTIGTVAEREQRGGADEPMHSDGESNTSVGLTTSTLSTPAAITERLAGQDPQPFVHIPLPGWVWNLERRKEWQAALNQWSKIENIIILVELPPASLREAILLAQNLPNVLWLARSGIGVSETRQELETLRNSEVNLIGAILNREPLWSTRSRMFEKRPAKNAQLVGLASVESRVDLLEKAFNEHLLASPEMESARLDRLQTQVEELAQQIASMHAQSDSVRTEIAQMEKTALHSHALEPPRLTDRKSVV